MAFNRGETKPKRDLIMDTNIFSQETEVLANAKKINESGKAGKSEYNKLVGDYSKLLRTTKRIIKLSDKNEHRLNELKQEAQ